MTTPLTVGELVEALSRLDPSYKLKVRSPFLASIMPVILYTVIPSSDPHLANPETGTILLDI